MIVLHHLRVVVHREGPHPRRQRLLEARDHVLRHRPRRSLGVPLGAGRRRRFVSLLVVVDSVRDELLDDGLVNLLVDVEDPSMMRDWNEIVPQFSSTAPVSK